MTADELIRENLEKFPDIPTMTLAKKLYKEHPAFFRGLENCRSMIRYRRGNVGNALRKSLKNKDHARDPGKAGWSIPKSIAKTQKPYKLTDGRWLILSDLHIPYHDEEAIENALDYGFAIGCDHVLLNGDVCDFFALSRWIKNPEERNFSRELQQTRHFLGYLRQLYPKGKIVYKLGNHEQRLQDWLFTKAPEIVGCSEFEMRTLLEFNKWGVEEVESKRKIKAGQHMTIIHGHEIFGGSAVNPARGLYMQMGVCAMKGHNHRPSAHQEKNADGKIMTCWSTGCLCHLEPDYAPVNKWGHGFATLDLEGNKFTVTNHSIIDGQVNNI